MREVLGKYCKTCNTTYFSRARHDFRPCPCFITSNRKTGGYVDGGRDYLKCGGTGVVVRITIAHTDKELEEDWRTQNNKYGYIKGDVGTPLIRKED